MKKHFDPADLSLSPYAWQRRLDEIFFGIEINYYKRLSEKYSELLKERDKQILDLREQLGEQIFGKE